MATSATQSSATCASTAKATKWPSDASASCSSSSHPDDPGKSLWRRPPSSRCLEQPHPQVSKVHLRLTTSKVRLVSTCAIIILLIVVVLSTPYRSRRQALEAFLDRPRERDASVIAREQQFLARELEVRETSRQQLRKYMIASDDAGDAVDPTDWSRYQYSGLRDVPRHYVDEATERAAQRTLFCAWRKRSVRRRTETRRQLRLTTSATAKPLSASRRRETLTAALQGLAPVLATTARKATALLLLSSRVKKPTGAQPAAS